MNPSFLLYYLVSVTITYMSVLRKQQRHRYPPERIRLPFIGNPLEVTTGGRRLTYGDWQTKFLRRASTPHKWHWRRAQRAPYSRGRRVAVVVSNSW